MRKILILLFVVLLSSCSDNSLKFKKSDYEKQWPFSVNEIEVFCSGYKEIYCKANGKIYPLNGSAKTASKNDPSINKIEEIWLDNPEFPGTKIPYQKFISEGLKICGD